MVLDFFHWRICGGCVMLKNVLRFLIASLSALFSSSVFAVWTSPTPVVSICDQSATTAQCGTDAAAVGAQSYRVISSSYGACPGSLRYACQIWSPYASTPCLLPQVWNQTTQLCETPPPPSCDDLPGSSWNGEACVCPAGTTQGYQCGVSTGCSNVCIDPTPPEGCPDGYLPFKIGEENHCFNPNPPSTCPEGSHPIIYNGISQCWTPDAGGDQCPPGTYYVEIGDPGQEVGQCFNPEPNIDDPDSSSSSSSSTSTSSSGGPGSSSSSGGGSGTTVDMSGVTSRLDQTNNKLDSANSKLDDANETLTGIKDILEGDGVGAMPEHTTASVGSFAEVNTGFLTRASNAPVVAAFGGIANMLDLSGAECPVFAVDIPAPIDVSVESSIHCEMFATIAPAISSVMMILWGWAAFRVFGSA